MAKKENIIVNREFAIGQKEGDIVMVFLIKNLKVQSI